ncbi:MAG: heme exporter protein CcmD [Phyllobacterium sp.]
MSSHAAFVVASYLAAFVALAALIGWIFIDQRIQRRALQDLEARGVRRRSEAKSENGS